MNTMKVNTMKGNPVGTLAKLASSIKSQQEISQMNIPEIEWHTEGIQPKLSRVGLIGEEKIGKSYFVLNWAMCLASGKPFLDFPCEQSHVLYMNGEIASEILDTRLQDLGAEPDFDRVTISPCNLAKDIKPVTDYLELEKILENPIDVLILDCRSNFLLGDENQSEVLNAWTRAVDKIIHDYNVSVIIVHHFGKNYTRGGRGSSVFNAWLDTVLELRKDREGITLNVKGRASEGETFAVDFNPPFWNISNVAGTTKRMATEEAKKKILNILDSGDSTPTKLERQLKSSSRYAVRRALKELNGEGKISIDKIQGVGYNKKVTLIPDLSSKAGGASKVANEEKD